MKARMFWLSLFLIGVSWVANSIYAHSKQVDEPIFLDHYIDITLQENVYIPLYYITNLNDHSSISYVNINGISGYVVGNNTFADFGFNDHSHVDQNLQSFTHHALRYIQLELNAFELENALENGEFTFNEIEVFFNDGGSLIVPIGEVTVHAAYSNNNVLDFLRVSGSSDGNSESVYRTTEALSINDITFKYDYILKDHLLIQIYSKDQPAIGNSPYTEFMHDWEEIPGVNIQNIELPYKLEESESLYIYTQIFPEFTGYMESDIRFSGTTSSGKIFTHYDRITSQQPYLSQKDIHKIIQE